MNKKFKSKKPLEISSDTGKLVVNDPRAQYNPNKIYHYGYLSKNLQYINNQSNTIDVNYDKYVIEPSFSLKPINKAIDSIKVSEIHEKDNGIDDLPVDIRMNNKKKLIDEDLIHIMSSKHMKLINQINKNKLFSNINKTNKYLQSNDISSNNIYKFDNQSNELIEQPMLNIKKSNSGLYEYNYAINKKSNSNNDLYDDLLVNNNLTPGRYVEMNDDISISSQLSKNYNNMIELSTNDNNIIEDSNSNLTINVDSPTNAITNIEIESNNTDSYITNQSNTFIKPLPNRILSIKPLKNTHLYRLKSNQSTNQDKNQFSKLSTNSNIESNNKLIITPPKRLDSGNLSVDSKDLKISSDYIINNYNKTLNKTSNTFDRNNNITLQSFDPLVELDERSMSTNSYVNTNLSNGLNKHGANILSSSLSFRNEDKQENNQENENDTLEDQLDQPIINQPLEINTLKQQPNSQPSIQLSKQLTNQQIKQSKRLSDRLLCYKCHKNGLFWCNDCNHAYCYICWNKITHHKSLDILASYYYNNDEISLTNEIPPMNNKSLDSTFEPVKLITNNRLDARKDDTLPIYLDGKGSISHISQHQILPIEFDDQIDIFNNELSNKSYKSNIYKGLSSHNSITTQISIDSPNLLIKSTSSSNINLSPNHSVSNIPASERMKLLEEKRLSHKEVLAIPYGPMNSLNNYLIKQKRLKKKLKKMNKQSNNMIISNIYQRRDSLPLPMKGVSLNFMQYQWKQTNPTYKTIDPLGIKDTKDNNIAQIIKDHTKSNNPSDDLTLSFHNGKGIYTREPISIRVPT